MIFANDIGLLTCVLDVPQNFIQTIVAVRQIDYTYSNNLLFSLSLSLFQLAKIRLLYVHNNNDDICIVGLDV